MKGDTTMTQLQAVRKFAAEIAEQKVIIARQRVHNNWAMCVNLFIFTTSFCFRMQHHFGAFLPTSSNIDFSSFYNCRFLCGKAANTMIYPPPTVVSVLLSPFFFGPYICIASA